MGAVDRLVSFFGSKKPRRGVRVAMLLDHGELLLAGIHDGLVTAVSETPCNDIQNIAKEVSAFCQRHELEGAAATLIPAPRDYQLLLVEAPPVPDAELADALRWKVKDLVQYSIEDAIVDGFALPDDAYRGRQKMVYAVATKKDALQLLCDEINSADLIVDRVEIPEQLILKAMVSLEKDANNAMVVAVGPENGILCIVSDGAIYLCRTLDMSGAAIHAEVIRNGDMPVTNNLVLEIQRSRDYYESQMGKGYVGELILAPMGVDCSGLSEKLTELLGSPVKELELSSIESSSEKTEIDFSGRKVGNHVLLHGAGFAV